MNIVCTDLEGVLVPEIWVEFARAANIPELTRTTRDEPDYDKLMKWRLGVLAEHNMGIKEIQQVIDTIEPLEGACEFLDELRATTQVIILSDTFEQFAQPLMRKTAASPATRCAARLPSSQRCRRCIPAATTPSPSVTPTTTWA